MHAARDEVTLLEAAKQRLGAVVRLAAVSCSAAKGNAELQTAALALLLPVIAAAGEAGSGLADLAERMASQLAAAPASARAFGDAVAAADPALRRRLAAALKKGRPESSSAEPSVAPRIQLRTFAPASTGLAFKPKLGTRGAQSDDVDDFSDDDF